MLGFDGAVDWQVLHLSDRTLLDAEGTELDVLGLRLEVLDVAVPVDEKSVTVVKAVGAVEGFTYEYDFGDGWDHDVTVEAVLRLAIGLKSAVCIDGANACSSEDCGGAGGYEGLRRVLADPSHEEHDDLVGWIGGPFAPQAFDLALTNARLQKVR